MEVSHPGSTRHVQLVAQQAGHAQPHERAEVPGCASLPALCTWKSEVLNQRQEATLAASQRAEGGRRSR